MAGTPSVALALGAGGARGLAHIAVLEALDEMGVQP
jgi:NTE family protein